ncbi:MAG: hypothetical protein ACLFQ3_09655 [Thiohalorhabdus sp.]
MSKKYLTPKQLAERWDVSLRALREMRYRADGPDYLRLNQKTIRYPIEAVIAYEREHFRQVQEDGEAGP